MEPAKVKKKNERKEIKQNKNTNTKIKKRRKNQLSGYFEICSQKTTNEKDHCSFIFGGPNKWQ
jgi:hypothetical protein